LNITWLCEIAQVSRSGYYNWKKNQSRRKQRDVKDQADFVLETFNKLFERHDIPKDQKTLIHSDQGIHYTSIQFQTLVNDHELRQSMSRRGNCWDNAPQESFFGHMKDELSDLHQLNTFQQLQEVLNDYMDYYNNERYQWNLAKRSPNQYDAFIKTGDYPLKNLVATPELPTVLLV
jgi:transposase InsO family protein